LPRSAKSRNSFNLLTFLPARRGRDADTPQARPTAPAGYHFPTPHSREDVAGPSLTGPGPGPIRS
jgi:hypothetical protein